MVYAHRLLVGLILASGLLVLPAQQLRAQVDPQFAQNFVQDLVVRAVARGGDADQPPRQREANFRELLGKGFAMRLIAKISLGKYWRRAKPADREAYIALFAEFMLKTYGPQISSFDTSRFHVDGATAKSRGDVFVHTRIDQPSGGPVRADWRIRTFAGEPRVIDIVIEGVSMTLTQKRQFASVVKKNGMAGLLEMLRARTRTLALDPSA